VEALFCLIVTMKATIKNALNVNKCGPDVVIAVMTASNSLLKIGNPVEKLFGQVSLTSFERFRFEWAFPSILLVFKDAVSLGDDAESFPGTFHNDSLMFIPKILS
jgi:hypothetical protein